MNEKTVLIDRPKMFYTIFNGKKHRTRFVRRFALHVGALKWEKLKGRCYLKVSYGRKMTNQGKIEEFWNDGFYTNRHDFNLAYKAFIE